MRVLNELDERQVRLGYINCVVLNAGSHLDTRTGLRRKFDAFVFRKVYEHSAEAAEFLAHIDAEGKRTLERQDRQRRRERGGSKALRDTLALLKRSEPKGGFRYVSHLWLLQRCMPSHLGPLAPDRSEVFLEHAKHLALIAETYSLTETGRVLRHLLLERDPALLEGRALPNPMYVGRRPAVRALYTWALLESDAVTPFLLREFLERRQNDPELLPVALEKLIESFERGARVDSALEMKSLRAYRERVARGGSAAARRTALRSDRRSPALSISAFLERGAPAQPGFKIHRHQVRPRLEHYVDIGLLGRRRHARGSRTVYEPVPETERAVEAWSPLLEDPKSVHRFLDTRFFGTMSEVYGSREAPQCTQWEALSYFARAFELVGREIGFTPGRTVSLTGCLLALEAGRVVEMDEMFEAVLACAKTDLGRHLIFSGGSRFDREFLVRVRPEIVPLLRDRIADPGRMGGRDESVR